MGLGCILLGLEEENLGQRAFRCFITPEEFKKILTESQTSFEFAITGFDCSKYVAVDLNILTLPDGLEFASFGLSEFEVLTNKYGSWSRGDLEFSNLSHVRGYIDMLQLALKTENSIIDRKIRPISKFSGELFLWITKEIKKISDTYDDLCVCPGGAKLQGKTRMTSGARTALLNGEKLTMGGSPYMEPKVFIALCGKPRSGQDKNV